MLFVRCREVVSISESLLWEVPVNFTQYKDGDLAIVGNFLVKIVHNNVWHWIKHKILVMMATLVI